MNDTRHVIWASFHLPCLPSPDGGGAGDSCRHCSYLIDVAIIVIMVVLSLWSAVDELVATCHTVMCCCCWCCRDR